MIHPHAHARIQPNVVSMVAAQPLRAASVEGIYGPKLHFRRLVARSAD